MMSMVYHKAFIFLLLFPLTECCLMLFLLSLSLSIVSDSIDFGSFFRCVVWVSFLFILRFNNLLMVFHFHLFDFFSIAFAEINEHNFVIKSIFVSCVFLFCSRYQEQKVQSLFLVCRVLKSLLYKTNYWAYFWWPLFGFLCWKFVLNETMHIIDLSFRQNCVSYQFTLIWFSSTNLQTHSHIELLTYIDGFIHKFISYLSLH